MDRRWRGTCPWRSDLGGQLGYIDRYHCDEGQVILRAGTEAGEAGVHVEAEGLGHAESRVIVG